MLYCVELFVYKFITVVAQYGKGYITGAKNSKTGGDPSRAPLMGDSCFTTDKAMWYTIECACDKEKVLNKGLYLTHNGEANILWCDGHIESLNKKVVETLPWHKLCVFDKF